MATFVGTAVDVVLPGAVVQEMNGMRWSIDAVADEVETTAGWTAATADRSYAAGWRSWSGTIEARVDDTTPLVVAGTALAGSVFHMSVARFLTGDIIITGMSVGAERNGEATVTWSFRGSGALVPT